MQLTKSFALATIRAFLLCCLLTVTAFGQQSGVVWLYPTTGQVQIWLQDSNGHFLGSQYVTNVCNGPCTNWEIVGTGDFDEDGFQDILWYNTNNGQIEAWLLDGEGNVKGNGTAIQYVSLPCNTVSGCAPAWQIVGTGDFNNDGHQDILWFNSTTGSLGVWLLDGHGNVSPFGNPPSQSFFLDQTCANPCAYGMPVGTGDFNNDGNLDILWLTPSGKFDVWLLNGAGHVTGHLTPDPICDTTSGCENGSILLAARVLGVGDFNNDGNPDIAFYNPATGQVKSFLLVPPQGHEIGVQTVDNNYSPEIFGPSWQPAAILKFGPTLFGEGYQLDNSGIGTPAGTLTLSGAGFTWLGAGLSTAHLKLVYEEDALLKEFDEDVNVGSDGVFTTHIPGLVCGQIPGQPPGVGVIVTATDLSTNKSVVAKYPLSCQP